MKIIKSNHFIYSYFLLLSALFFTTVLSADTSYKIGFVNTGKVLKEAPQARAVEERLKASFIERETILKKKQDELVALERKIKTDDILLSASDKRKLEREFRLKVSQLKFQQQEFKEDQNLKRNEEIRLLQNLIAKVLVQIGDTEQFDLILTEGVTYVSNKIDITPKVIAALKKELETSVEQNQ